MASEKVQVYTSGTIITAAQGTGSPSTTVKSWLHATSGNAVVPILCDQYGNIGQFVKKYHIPQFSVNSSTQWFYTSGPINGELVGLRYTPLTTGSIHVRISGAAGYDVELFVKKYTSGTSQKAAQVYLQDNPFSVAGIQATSESGGWVNHAVSDKLAICISGGTSGTANLNGPITILYR